MRALALVVLAAALAAGCDAGTRTIVATTTAADEDAAAEANAEARREGARQVVFDLCRSLPVERAAGIAFGVDPDDERAVAEELAAGVRPELRAAAVEGCAEALRSK